VPHCTLQLHPVRRPQARRPPRRARRRAAVRPRRLLTAPWGLVCYLLLSPACLQTASVYMYVCPCGWDLWGFRISASSLVRASSDDVGKGNKIRRIQMEEQINKNFFFPPFVDSRSLLDANYGRMQRDTICCLCT